MQIIFDSRQVPLVAQLDSSRVESTRFNVAHLSGTFNFYVCVVHLTLIYFRFLFVVLLLLLFFLFLLHVLFLLLTTFSFLITAAFVVNIWPRRGATEIAAVISYEFLCELTFISSHFFAQFFVVRVCVIVCVCGCRRHA